VYSYSVGALVCKYTTAAVLKVVLLAVVLVAAAAAAAVVAPRFSRGTQFCACVAHCCCNNATPLQCR
jgi:hypothetical protein